MSDLRMDPTLGSKWFTFYTKVRPWLAGIATLAMVGDFIEYTSVYSTYWWMLLYFLGSVAQAVLAVIAAVKAKNDYFDFVKFVKGVLIFEFISLAYYAAVQQYVKTAGDFGGAVFIFLLFLVLGYLLWYRLNMKYFEKRITVKEFPKVDNSEKKDIHICLSSEDEKPVRHPGNVYSEDIIFKEESSHPENDSIKKDAHVDKKVTSQIYYCRKCGNKLTEDSLFCCQCGTKIYPDD